MMLPEGNWSFCEYFFSVTVISERIFMILCKQISVTKRMNVSWGNPTLDFYKIWETSKIPLNNLPQDLNVFFSAKPLSKL